MKKKNFTTITVIIRNWHASKCILLLIYLFLDRNHAISLQDIRNVNKGICKFRRGEIALCNWYGFLDIACKSFILNSIAGFTFMHNII